jgi:hypothetical protein
MRLRRVGKPPELRPVDCDGDQTNDVGDGGVSGESQPAETTMSTTSRLDRPGGSAKHSISRQLDTLDDWRHTEAASLRFCDDRAAADNWCFAAVGA